MSRKSCNCQECNCQYKVDLIIPDDLWEKIKPEGKPEGEGLLCGACIMNKIESLNEYNALIVLKDQNGYDWRSMVEGINNLNKRLKSNAA